MRQGSNPKRSRGKGGNRGANGSRNPLNKSFESNGPGGKVRGNPHQVYEKYLAMARDYQADDPIMAENLLQHADHYFRLILDANNGAKSKRDDNRRADGEDKAESSGNADGGDQDKTANRESASSEDGAANSTAGDESADSGEGAGSASAEDSAGEQDETPKRSRRGRKSKSGDDPETKANASDAA